MWPAWGQGLPAAQGAGWVEGMTTRPEGLTVPSPSGPVAAPSARAGRGAKRGGTAPCAARPGPGEDRVKMRPGLGGRAGPGPPGARRAGRPHTSRSHCCVRHARLPCSTATASAAAPAMGVAGRGFPGPAPALLQILLLLLPLLAATVLPGQGPPEGECPAWGAPGTALWLREGVPGSVLRGSTQPSGAFTHTGGAETPPRLGPSLGAGLGSLTAGLGPGRLTVPALAPAAQG